MRTDFLEEHTISTSLNWSQLGEAVRTFRDVPRLHAESPQSPDIDLVTDRWIELVKARFSQMERIDLLGLLRGTTGDVLLDSVFVTARDGKLQVREVSMTFDRQQTGFASIVA